MRQFVCLMGLVGVFECSCRGTSGDVQMDAGNPVAAVSSIVPVNVAPSTSGRLEWPVVTIVRVTNSGGVIEDLDTAIERIRGRARQCVVDYLKKNEGQHFIAGMRVSAWLSERGTVRRIETQMPSSSMGPGDGVPPKPIVACVKERFVEESFGLTSLDNTKITVEFGMMAPPN